MKQNTILIIISIVIVLLIGTIAWVANKSADSYEHNEYPPAPPTKTDGKQWELLEDNGKCFPTVAKLCSDMYENSPELFHNRWSTHAECENDVRMIPMKCRPNNLKYFCNRSGDPKKCMEDPIWNTTGLQVSLCPQ